MFLSPDTSARTRSRVWALVRALPEPGLTM
jgi:hypothetical protein